MSPPPAILGTVLTEIPRALQQQAFLQCGIVTRNQAVTAGLSPAAIAWRLKRHVWQQVHHGTYATFSGPIEESARLWAAVLYSGEGAHLSHWTAAKLNKLADDTPKTIDITIPAKRIVKPPEGVVIHRSRIKPIIWTPPKTPPYAVAEITILDLVEQAATEDEVIALITGGFNKKRLAENHLLAYAKERKNLRWRSELDEIIKMAAGGAHSVLEYRHDWDVQRAHGLPEPAKQAKFRKQDGTIGYRDRYYPQFGGLVIELDGKRYHQDEHRDRTRDNQAAVTGTTLRYGWDDITRRPCETARQEAEALRHRGWTGTLKKCSPQCRAVIG